MTTGRVQSRESKKRNRLDMARTKEAREWQKRVERARASDRAGESVRECDQRVDISCREGGSHREGLLLRTENLFHKFQRNASFYLNTRNPSTVQR